MRWGRTRRAIDVQLGTRSHGLSDCLAARCRNLEMTGFYKFFPVLFFGTVSFGGREREDCFLESHVEQKKNE